MSTTPETLALLRRAAGDDDVIGLAGGLPAELLLPRTALARAVQTAIAASPEPLQYGWPEGDARLRAWIAARLVARGAAVDADDVIVTAGAQQALALAAAALGGRIEVPAETYPAALDAFASGGGGAPVARYVIVGVDNPRGVDRVDAGVLDHPGAVIADEAYAELRFDGRVPRPLLADARDRVWHVGTVSKVLCPGLRIGWLVPPPAARDAVLAAKVAADLQTCGLAQAALVSLLDEFDLDALIARARGTYVVRAAALADALHTHLPFARFSEPEGGFSIWLELDDACDAAGERALLAAAIAAGTSFDPGSMFRPSGATSPLALRVSFSHTPPEAFAEGARRLADAVDAWARG